jgi:hypothetical protein
MIFALIPIAPFLFLITKELWGISYQLKRLADLKEEEMKAKRHIPLRIIEKKD